MDAGISWTFSYMSATTRAEAPERPMRGMPWTACVSTAASRAVDPIAGGPPQTFLRHVETVQARAYGK